MVYNITMLTLEKISNNGFSAVEVESRIFLLEDFLTTEEVEELLAISKAATQDEWEGAYLDNMKDFCMSKFGRDDIENLVAEGKLELTGNWNDKILRIDKLKVSGQIGQRVTALFDGVDGLRDGSSVGIIQRQYEGVALTEHVDNHTDPSLDYACVAYLNDDYEGGEVFFSKFGIDLKPKPGSLLVFPTTEDWSHGVYEVKAGPVRYVLPIFVGKKDFYKDNKY